MWIGVRATHPSLIRGLEAAERCLARKAYFPHKYGDYGGARHVCVLQIGLLSSGYLSGLQPSAHLLPSCDVKQLHSVLSTSC